MACASVPCLKANSFDYTNELTLLREQVEYLRQKLYGKSSEKVVHQSGQLSLFGEESLP
ncbi:transposase domain-containing protein, partial [Streptococcus suis]